MQPLPDTGLLPGAQPTPAGHPAAEAELLRQMLPADPRVAIASGIRACSRVVVGGREIELPSVVYAEPMARAGVFHRAGRMGDDGSRRSVCQQVIVTSRDGRHHRQVVAVRVSAIALVE